MNLDKWPTIPDAARIAARMEQDRREREALERMSRDPEAEPAIVMFRAGDVCGDCGAPLDIRAPDAAACPNCGPNALPF